MKTNQGAYKLHQCGQVFAHIAMVKQVKSDFYVKVSFLY